MIEFSAGLQAQLNTLDSQHPELLNGMNPQHQQENRRLIQLSLAGLVLLVIFSMIFSLSKPYEYGSSLPQPTLVVVGLFFVAVITVLFGQAVAVHCEPNRRLLFLVIGFAISVRMVALFTCPILEIDYYRYLWDGKVVAQTISPYKYSPSQITQEVSQTRINPKATAFDPEIEKLTELATESESNHTIVHRIHFGEYSTIYPPVSQAVFGLAMCWFPSSASIEAHVLFIKLVLVGFDLATLWIILLTLARLNIHVGWSLAYAWNPLVIKEIANGGHLDSIAAFFLMLSVFVLIAWLSRTRERRTWHLPVISAFILGLGFGAKLFPVILLPALLISIARVRKSTALMFGVVFVIAAGATFLPMYLAIAQRTPPPEIQRTSDTEETATNQDTGIAQWGGLPPSLTDEPPIVPLDETDSATPAPDNKEGLTSFLSTWRMNDVIFSGIYLNLKASDSSPPWYVVTSNEFRESVDQFSQNSLPSSSNGAFALTRLITMGFFSIFYVVQLVAIYRQPQKHRETLLKQESKPDTGKALQLDFDKLAWISIVFLFLQPTVNPWYWVWIAPLTVFCQNRGWLIVGGLLLAYYLRFWFQLNPESISIAGYSGIGLYDHCVSWVAFGCVIAAVLFFRLDKPSRERRRARADEN